MDYRDFGTTGLKVGRLGALATGYPQIWVFRKEILLTKAVNFRCLCHEWRPQTGDRAQGVHACAFRNPYGGLGNHCARRFKRSRPSGDRSSGPEAPWGFLPNAGSWAAIQQPRRVSPFWAVAMLLFRQFDQAGRI